MRGKMDEEYGSNYEHDLFPNSSAVHVKVDILNDLWEALKAEFAANEWTEEEGLGHIMAAGLAYLRAERLREEVAAGADLEPRYERVLHKWMEMEGRFAVMKYRAYQALQDAKTLSWKLSACRQERDNLDEMIKHLRKKSEGTS